MLGRVCVAVLLSIGLSGVALAADECAVPAMTPGQFTAASAPERAAEYQRLVNCATASVGRAQAALGNLRQLNAGDVVNALASERDRLQALLKTETDALDAANAQIANLIDERNRLNAELDAARAASDQDGRRVATLLDQMPILQAQIADLTKKLADLQQQYDRQSEQARDTQAKLDQATAEIVRLTAEGKSQADQIQTVTGQLADLTKQLADANAEITTIAAQNHDFADQLKRSQDDNGDLAKKAADAEQALAAAQGKIDELNAKIDRLTADSGQLTQQLQAANSEIAQLNGQLQAANAQVAQLTAQVSQLTDQLQKANDEIAKLTDDLNGAKADLATAEADLVSTKDQLATAKAQLDAANQHIAMLECTVDRLGSERSLFFANLSKTLGPNSPFKIVGDRFIFPTDVLFPVGSDALSKGGQDQIAQVATALNHLLIPASIGWVLQVNGHTDVQKMHKGKFTSNWDLSTARALRVVELLQSLHVAPEHLAAAGFGEYQPIDPARTQAAYQANRRIELKLTDYDGAGPASADTARPGCPTT